MVEGLPRPFADRSVHRWPFSWTPQEQILVDALGAYRRAGRTLLTRLTPQERTAGRFVFSPARDRVSAALSQLGLDREAVESDPTGEGPFH